MSAQWDEPVDKSVDKSVDRSAEVDPELLGPTVHVGRVHGPDGSLRAAGVTDQR
jgi:hypothetical protein